jgi:uncharacterized protein (TIGR02284 family)
MATDNKAVVSVLNDLIETCKDGVDGFRSAAAAVQHAGAKTLFESRVPAIELAATELQAAVKRLGGEAETTGSTAAAVHRGWIGLKAAVTGRSDAAITTECERGEQLAASHYEKALKASLPADVHALVERQYAGAVKNLERIRALGDAVGAGTPVVAPRPAADSEAPPRM